MKYIKLFMLLAVVSLFAACSDDDEDGALNTQAVTAGFESDTLVVKENTGYVNIPIRIEGYRNGRVAVEVATEETGANPAVENTNYRITDKSLQYLAKNDTTDVCELNVQMQTLDDEEINANREFTLNIVKMEGAKPARTKIVVILRDNDAAFYEKFFGKWKLSGTLTGSSGTTPFEKEITISGPNNETDRDYDRILTVAAPSFVNVGANVDFAWHFGYSFDNATKQGTLSIIFNEVNASLNDGAYQWTLLGVDGKYLTDVPYVTTWKLGEGNAFPTEISFKSFGQLYMYRLPNQGTWRIFTFDKMVKE